MVSPSKRSAERRRALELLAASPDGWPRRSCWRMASADPPQICATFQRDNLPRHFRVRVLHAQPASRVSTSHVSSPAPSVTIDFKDLSRTLR
jgi:hypothetical protein